MQRTIKLAVAAVAVVAIVLLAAGAMTLWRGRQTEVASERDVTPETSEGAATQVPATGTPKLPLISSAFTTSGRIAFPSDRDGNKEIYVMNADGGGLMRLTDNPAEDLWPSWSPDGTRIAFASDRDGN